MAWRVKVTKGLDVERDGRRLRFTEPYRVVVAQIGLLLGALILWEVTIVWGFASEFFFGRPTRVLSYVLENTWDGYLLEHAWVTFYEQLLGFGIGTCTGIGIGLSLWWFPFLRWVFEPFAIVLNATPKIVMAPLLVAWFGIGLMSKVSIAVLVCAVVAWVSAMEGMRSADADQMDMIKALGGRRWDMFRKIVFPSCLPWFMMAARLNIGLALVGAITGEFLASTEGLGYLVDKTALRYEMSETLGVLAVIAVVAAGQYYALRWVESRVLHWAAEGDIEFVT